jgi:membrane-associated phospholipid phosphatase
VLSNVPGASPPVDSGFIVAAWLNPTSGSGCQKRSPKVARNHPRIGFGFLTTVTKAVSGRERPYAREQNCDELGVDCGSGANASYFSGHTSFAFAGAGLTCVAHRHLGLFGRVGDPLACASTLTLASVTAVFRIMANAHWMTDVLTGAGIGLFTGWLVPWLMHFRHDTSERDDGVMRVVQYLSPYGRSNEFGLRAAGTF